MRKRHAMTISLPPAMAKEFERVRKAEHRTQSELVREALRLVELCCDLRRNPQLSEELFEERELPDLDKAADWGGVADRDHPDDRMSTSRSSSSVV